MLVETHSVYILKKLSQLIAHSRTNGPEPISEDDVKLYYVSKGPKDVAVVKEIKVPDSGPILLPKDDGMVDLEAEMLYDILTGHRIAENDNDSSSPSTN